MYVENTGVDSLLNVSDFIVRILTSMELKVL